MIIILKDRYHQSKDGEKRAFTPYCTKNGELFTNSVPNLFANIDKCLSLVEDGDRFNLHYTLAEYERSDKKKFIKQEVIPLDLDDIDVDKIEEYIAVVLKVIKHKREDVGIVASGHGLHFLIGIKTPITDADYFTRQKEVYQYLAGSVAAEVYKAMLPLGEVDLNLWRNKATLRLPNTMNRKEGRPEVPCRMIQPNINPQIHTLSDLVDLPEVQEGHESLKVYPTPDTKAVLDGCIFLNHCRNHQDEINEPQWYAMLTILSKLENGRMLCHEYSEQSHQYKASEADRKIDYAESVGPRTCANIASMWSGCNGCTHYKKVPSPVCIQGDDHIGTQDTGFHFVEVKKDGSYKYKPDYEGLRRFFEKQHQYITMTDSKMVYIWTGTHWEYCPDTYIENFANEHFSPIANNSMRSEFKNLVFTTNIRSSRWFDTTIEGFMNFSNGILNMKTGDLLPHSTDFGFLSVLAYPFDKNATCPTFDKFMENVTLNRPGLTKVLMQFMGYAFSGESCKYAKALIMHGSGANGKSTLINVMKRAAGELAYSSLTLPELHSDQNRYELVGKFFNMSEETPNRKALDSSVFKNLVSGGEFMIKVVYKTPFKHKNKTKIILACNELPEVEDTTHGMFRRLLIVPFDACFTGIEDTGMEEKLCRELPGIFNRIVEGYRELLKNGGFAIPKEVEKEVADYRLHSDDVYYFVNKHCETQPQGVNEQMLSQMPLEEFYNKYSNYIQTRMNKKPLPFRNFQASIKRIMPTRLSSDTVWGVSVKHSGGAF